MTGQKQDQLLSLRGRDRAVDALRMTGQKQDQLLSLRGRDRAVDALKMTGQKQAQIFPSGDAIRRWNCPQDDNPRSS